MLWKIAEKKNASFEYICRRLRKNYYQAAVTTKLWTESKQQIRVKIVVPPDGGEIIITFNYWTKITITQLQNTTTKKQWQQQQQQVIILLHQTLDHFWNIPVSYKFLEGVWKQLTAIWALKWFQAKMYRLFYYIIKLKIEKYLTVLV